MLTLKHISTKNRPVDWFVMIDLKDAYFHIQIIQRLKNFLRVTFGGNGFQF